MSAAVTRCTCGHEPRLPTCPDRRTRPALPARPTADHVLGEPWKPERWSDRHEQMARATEVPKVTLHGSQHAAASLLADLGMPDVAGAAWLGHTEVQVTKGCTRIFAETLVETGRALGDALTRRHVTRI